MKNLFFKAIALVLGGGTSSDPNQGSCRERQGKLNNLVRQNELPHGDLTNNFIPQFKLLSCENERDARNRFEKTFAASAGSNFVMDPNGSQSTEARRCRGHANVSSRENPSNEVKTFSDIFGNGSGNSPWDNYQTAFASGFQKMFASNFGKALTDVKNGSMPDPDGAQSPEARRCMEYASESAKENSSNENKTFSDIFGDGNGNSPWDEYQTAFTSSFQKMFASNFGKALTDVKNDSMPNPDDFPNIEDRRRQRYVSESIREDSMNEGKTFSNTSCFEKPSSASSNGFLTSSNIISKK